MRSFHCAWLKKLQGHRKRKTAKFLLWNRKKQVTVWSASDFVGPVTTRVVIALWALTREVNLLRWVVGLSFRSLEAIPKSSFLSKLRNHPSEPGESSHCKNSNRRRPEVCKSNGSSRNPRRGCEKLPREPGRSPFYEKVYGATTPSRRCSAVRAFACHYQLSPRPWFECNCAYPYHARKWTSLTLESKYFDMFSIALRAPQSSFHLARLPEHGERSGKREHLQGQRLEAAGRRQIVRAGFEILLSHFFRWGIRIQEIVVYPFRLFACSFLLHLSPMAWSIVLRSPCGRGDVTRRRVPCHFLPDKESMQLSFLPG